MRSSSPRIGLLLGLGTALLVAACKSTTPPGVYFDSHPPGAEVLVDGRRTGYVTPCLIALGRERSFRIHLTLEGYVTREFSIRANDRTEWITWDEGAMAPSGIGGPFGLDFDDLLLPGRKDEAHAPNRIFRRLAPANLD